MVLEIHKLSELQIITLLVCNSRWILRHYHKALKHITNALLYSTDFRQLKIHKKMLISDILENILCKISLTAKNAVYSKWGEMIRQQWFGSVVLKYYNYKWIPTKNVHIHRRYLAVRVTARDFRFAACCRCWTVTKISL